MTLTAEDLLAGGSLAHEVELPSDLLRAKGDASLSGGVVIRPLTVRDLQRIGKAGRDGEEVAAALIIQQGLVEPSLTMEQVAELPAGAARFLVERINEISGVTTPRDELEEMVQEPLARACFFLAKEFGWTAEEVSAMTVGQILLYLELARGEA